MDEKYVQESHKDLQIEGIKPRKRKEAASKRDLSNKKFVSLRLSKDMGKQLLKLLLTWQNQRVKMLKRLLTIFMNILITGQTG